jgi:4'-phosphopantetheinyl transferase
MGAPPIEIWKVDLDGVTQALGGAAALTGHLTAGDQERLGATQNATARTRRAAAWIALRKAAEQALGVLPGGLEIARDAHGKPMVASHVLEISLAHAGHLGLIGISRSGPIGVDIDQVRAVTLSVPRRAHLVALAAALADATAVPEPDTEAGFVQAWTRIEAVAKARGDGLARLLGETRHSALADPHVAAVDLDLGIDGFRAAVALPRAGMVAGHVTPRWFGPVALAELDG